MKHQRCCKAHTVLDLRACAFKDAPLPSSMCVENTPALKRVFKNYCKYALGQGRVYSNEGVPHMNAQQFHRLCQDAGFVEPEASFLAYLGKLPVLKRKLYGAGITEPG
eukprot:scaffold142427_cov19-Tisochrysis_lutea.AAC.2